MVLVGGATRLTESGLSIVEWRPVTGTIPPLSQADWEAAFKQYQAIPQYKAINQGMSLEDFKTIYWWEWAHRFLGRLIGAAFLLPFLWLLWRGAISPGMRPRLWGIFALGAFQGAVGWWMVASGLADRITVSPYRLAFHLTLACVIYAAVVWTVRTLARVGFSDAPPRLRRTALALIGLIFLQIYVGALVAGVDAGFVYNTWPLIDGTLVPAADKLFALSPAWRNFFENDLTVQFVHRLLAYTLVLVIFAHAADVLRTTREAGTRGFALALAVLATLQAALGIATLLLVVPISLALAHQAGALVLLTVAVMHATRLAPAPARDIGLATPPPALAQGRQ